MKLTIFLYAYNHEQFIGKAADAVLNQDYPGECEIIFSDDCSTDRTFEIMRQKADECRNKRPVILNRNETNLGITGHLNKIIGMGTGDWFVLCAGDDVSLPNRLSTLVGIIEKHPDVMAINTAMNVIDEHETPFHYQGFDDMLPFVTGATGAWNRKLFDFFGPITYPTTAEDVVIPFRAMLLGRLAILNAPTINYRMHSGSVSAPLGLEYQASLEHLIKIKGQLTSAVSQRLADLERCRGDLAEADYERLKKRHLEIRRKLEADCKILQLKRKLLDSTFPQRLHFLLSEHDIGLTARIKLIMKTDRLLMRLYRTLKKPSQVHRKYSRDGKLVLVSYHELCTPKYDVMIYL